MTLEEITDKWRELVKQPEGGDPGHVATSTAILFAKKIADLVAGQGADTTQRDEAQGEKAT